MCKSKNRNYFRASIIYNKISNRNFLFCKVNCIVLDKCLDFLVFRARKIGEIIGMAFQIKDDIFDYYDNTVIGKPTGNDIREGKLTLPILHALSTANNEEMNELALKAKRGEATDEDIKCLIDFTITMGGIDYANKVMEDLIEEADKLLAQYPDDDIRKGLNSFIDYVVEREK